VAGSFGLGQVIWWPKQLPDAARMFAAITLLGI
jgi:ABC-type nitrate/sulfonate/bicarbonate transport system permease component